MASKIDQDVIAEMLVTLESLELMDFSLDTNMVDTMAEAIVDAATHKEFGLRTVDTCDDYWDDDEEPTQDLIDLMRDDDV